MKIRLILGVFIFCLFGSALASEEGNAILEEEKYVAWANGILDDLDKKTGMVKLGKAGALLNIPDSFYYLDASDSERVLVEVWGNPPGQTILGMLFPAETTPFDEHSWAVTIEYEEDGYVSDEDADQIDYAGLLSKMQEDTLKSSQAQVKEGYDAVELVGWATPPYYDSVNKKLHWAKEIKLGGEGVNTLNYNIRVLGRKGVLVLNFIAGMEQKEQIDSNMQTVLALAEFEPGAQYSDFNPDVDKVAAYGLGALVAGKPPVKTGFLAITLIFIKKFWILIVLGLGAIITGLFYRKNKNISH